MVFLFVDSSALTGGFLPTGPRDPAVASVKCLGQTDSRYESQPDRIPAQGTFTPSVHAHVRRTPAYCSEPGDIV